VQPLAAHEPVRFVASFDEQAEAAGRRHPGIAIRSAPTARTPVVIACVFGGASSSGWRHSFTDAPAIRRLRRSTSPEPTPTSQARAAPVSPTPIDTFVTRP